MAAWIIALLLGSVACTSAAAPPTPTRQATAVAPTTPAQPSTATLSPATAVLSPAAGTLSSATVTLSPSTPTPGSATATSSSATATRNPATATPSSATATPRPAAAIPTASAAQPTPQAQPTRAALPRPVLPVAPTVSSGRREATLVAGPRTRLEQLAASVQRNDAADARTAIDAFDSEWSGVEVYVDFRSKALHDEIDAHYATDLADALQEPRPDFKAILPMVESMVEHYDEAIRQADSGKVLSALFDDLATVRIARAPLRTVSPALRAGDTAKASAAFAEFKTRWPTAEPLLSAEVRQRTVDALRDANQAMASPSPSSAEAIDALLERYDAGVSQLDAAARQAGYQPE